MKITQRKNKSAKIELMVQLCILVIILLSTNAIASSTKPQGFGLNHQTYPVDDMNPFAKIHVIEIDINTHNLDFCDIKEPVTSQEAHQNNPNAIMVFNGGFFATDKKPLGLRVSQGRLISRSKPISWWHVFLVENKSAKIVHRITKKFNKKNHSFAIQAGPRLIKNRHIISLKDGLAARTALGIKENGHVVVIISQYAQITTKYLANFMKKTLNVKDAINLDGGSSTQMSLNINDGHINVYGVGALPDPICVYKN